MTFKKFIKSFDEYGHPIKLKFDDKGDTHKTLVGGIVSIVSKIALTVYFAALLYKMGTYGDDKIKMLEINNQGNILNPSLNKARYFKDWKMIPIFAFHNKSDGTRSMNYEETKRYVTVEVEHRYRDFDDSSNNKNTPIKTRECVDEDFSWSKFASIQFDRLEYFKPYRCLDNTEEVYLKASSLEYTG